VSNTLYAIAIVLCGIVAAFIVHGIFGWLQKRADLTDSKFDDIIVLSLRGPLLISVIVGSIFVAVTWFLDSASLGAYAWLLDVRYFKAIGILLAAWVISSFAYNFISLYGRWMASRTEADIDDRIIHILELGSRYIVWFIGILMVMQTLEFDITPLIAGAGIASLAVALAAQDIIGNVIGGAVIMTDRPFRVNDRVLIGAHFGDVISIGPRSTRIKRLDFQLITIPKSKITSSVVVNYALPDVKMRICVPVPVAYGSDIKLVREMLLEAAHEIAEESPYVLFEPKPVVYFDSYGASSLNFKLMVWATECTLEPLVRDYVNTRVNELVLEHNIRVPFPQMDVHIQSVPGRAEMRLPSTDLTQLREPTMADVTPAGVRPDDRN